MLDLHFIANVGQNAKDKMASFELSEMEKSVFMYSSSTQVVQDCQFLLRCELDFQKWTQLSERSKYNISFQVV